MPDDVGIVKQAKIVAELDMVSTCAANGHLMAGRKNYLGISALQGLHYLSLDLCKAQLPPAFSVHTN